MLRETIMTMPKVEPPKKVYVVISSADGSPNIRGYDSYLTSWNNVSSCVSDYLDALELLLPATLTFTIYEWAEEEYREYVEKNGVELESEP